MATKLSDLPTYCLRLMLAENERSVGKDAVSTQLIRRELARRERRARDERKEARHE